MTTPNVTVRRATVEDIPKLVPLWQQDSLPWQELERRFKDFQVVEGPGGEVLGALGLHIHGHEARLHAEVFAHPEQADELREVLWERAQVIAKNHGLVRLWTQLATPFWHRSGFQTPSADTLAKLPGTFGGIQDAWRFVQLKEEAPASISLDKEFALFRESEKEQTEKLFRQAKTLKVIAAIVAILVCLLIVVWAITFFKAQRLRH